MTYKLNENLFKVTYNGLEGYVITDSENKEEYYNSNIKAGDLFYNTDLKDVIIAEYSPSSKISRKIIATSGFQLGDLPQFVIEDNIEDISYDWLYENDTEHMASKGYPLVPMQYGFKKGWSKHAEKYKYTKENLINFAKFYILNHVIPYELDVISGKITEEQKIQYLENDVGYEWEDLFNKFIQSLN